MKKSTSEGQLRHSEQFVTVHNWISYTRTTAAVTTKIPEFNDKKNSVFSRLRLPPKNKNANVISVKSDT